MLRNSRGSARLVSLLIPLICGAVLGVGGVKVLDRGQSSSNAEQRERRPVTTVPAAAGTVVAPPAAASSTSTAPPTVIAAPPVPHGGGNPVAMASALAPMRLPSDCGLPLDNPESLPNASRDYRGGVHEGIDFICRERGRFAVAALDGRIVMANNSFVDPKPAERAEVLAVAKSLGYTPPWTLAMMFGRFVVIDHGVVPDVGHVVSIYAHFDEIDPAIRPGLQVKAGTRLGEIGNRGTETGATGGTRPQSIHLHWELHIDDEFLGKGLTGAQTSLVYATLFGP